MPKKEKYTDLEVIFEYQKNINDKEEKTFEKIMQKLFNSYIIKEIQNIKKGK